MDHTDRLSIAKGRYGCYKRLAICLLNAGLAACFELEDLRSWTVVSGGAWEVKDFDHPNKSGRFYATTCDEVWPGNGGCKNGSGERDTGILVSEVFTAPGGFLEFRIAGFNGWSCNSTFNLITLQQIAILLGLRMVSLLPSYRIARGMAICTWFRWRMVNQCD